MAKKLDNATLKAARRLIEDCCDNAYEIADEMKAEAQKAAADSGFDSHEFADALSRVQLWSDIALAYNDLLEDFDYKVEQYLK